MDAHIRHCRLRVVRRGGWSWGLDRPELIRMASKAVPRLVAEALAHLKARGIDEGHADELKLRMSASVTELLAAGHKLTTSDTQRSSAIAEQIRTQISAPAQADDAPMPSTEPARPTMAHSSVAELIAAWRSDGSLERRLRVFPTAGLAHWERLWMASTQNVASHDIETSALIAYARMRLSHFRNGGGDEHAIRQSRLLLLAELEAHYGKALPAASLRQVLATVLPIAPAPRDSATQSPTVSAGNRVEQHERDAASIDLGNTEKRTPPAVFDIDTPRRLDTRVASGLPWLILGVLAHTSHLKALSATLGDDAPAAIYGAALAMRLLGSAGGCPLSDSERRKIVTAFALTDTLPGPQAFADFEHRIGSALTAADAAICIALKQGYTVGSPLLIVNRAGRRMVFDTEGLYPLAIANTRRQLRRILTLFGPTDVWLPFDSVDEALLADVGECGCRFVTNVPPGRSDTWKPLDRKRQYWTVPEAPGSTKQLGRFQRTSEDAGQFAERLALDLDSRLAESTTLATGLGLADIAYHLWGDSEPTHPMLAYRRLHDLDARVRVDDEQVRVSLALGRRFMDLRDAGLLTDVTGVPWFGGRTLTYTGL